MKKISENWAIIVEAGFDHDTLKVEVMDKVLRIEGLERSDTISGHITFFEKVIQQLKEFEGKE